MHGDIGMLERSVLSLTMLRLLIEQGALVVTVSTISK